MIIESLTSTPSSMTTPRRITEFIIFDLFIIAPSAIILFVISPPNIFNAGSSFLDGRMGHISFLISNILSDNDSRKMIFGEKSQLVVPGHTVAVKT
jgi:hypothetical protein